MYYLLLLRGTGEKFADGSLSLVKPYVVPMLGSLAVSLQQQKEVGCGPDFTSQHHRWYTERIRPNTVMLNF